MLESWVWRIEIYLYIDGTDLNFNLEHHPLCYPIFHFSPIPFSHWLPTGNTASLRWIQSLALWALILYLLFSFFRHFTRGRIGWTGATPATALISFFVFFIITAPEQSGRKTDDNYNNKSFHFYFTILSALIQTYGGVLSVIFFHHRDTENTETPFLFAHRETAMVKNPEPSVKPSRLVEI